MGKSHFSGQVMETGVANSQAAIRTESLRTGVMFVDATATDYVPGDAAVTITRVLVGQYVKRRTAATGAQTDQLWFTINNRITSVNSNTIDTTGQLEQTRGIRITSFDLVYRPGVASLTSLTPTLQIATMTDGAAFPAATNSPVTPTLAAAGDLTFHATQLQRATFTVTTPLIILPTQSATIDITAVLATTGTLDWHGVFISYDYLL